MTSRVLPRLRSVTEQLKPEDNGLTTFLKRCNERNFSVQVRGTDIERQSTNKVKGSEYVLTLEPIAEGTVRAGGSNINIKVDNDKVLEHVNHDTNMMLHGAETLTCDMNVESVDYETTVHADVVANLSPDEPASNETLYPKAVDIRTANTEPTNIQPAVEPIKVEHNTVEPTNLKHTESQQSPEGITKFKLADAEVTIYQEQSQNTDHWDEATALQDPAVKTGEEVETNAWGKPMKPDPTRNKEGAIVGGQAKPLGAENKGRAMMEKMGWSSGTGLGKQMGGILEPITHVVKNTKTGLRTSDEKSRKSGLSLSFAENTPNSTSGQSFLTLRSLRNLLTDFRL